MQKVAGPYKPLILIKTSSNSSILYLLWLSAIQNLSWLLALIKKVCEEDKCGSNFQEVLEERKLADKPLYWARDFEPPLKMCAPSRSSGEGSMGF